jgi:hypothetical protein
MSDTEKDQEFYTMADAFIAKANDYGGKTDPGKISATFLYAAARFNAFLVASAAESPEEFLSRKDEAVKYFMSEYEKMLEEHFADYHKRFNTYIDPKK